MTLPQPYVPSSIAIQPDQIDIGNDESSATLLVSDDERYYVTETPTGLTFRGDTPLEVWGPLTARLLRVRKRVEFAIADAINFGHRYGERYSQWVHDIGYAEQSLHNIAWVGRQIESSRRREDISFSAHAEVASLPPSLQETVLEQAAEEQWTLRETRDAARKAAAADKAAKRALLPVPDRTPPDCTIVQGDALEMALDDEVVDLLLTSPPYALDKPYGAGGDVDPYGWRTFIQDFCFEVFRVLKPHGRFAFNIPLDTTKGGFRPTYAEAVDCAIRAGLTYRTTIVWHDTQLGKSTARGSYDQERGVGTAQAPHAIAPVEMIGWFSKDEWWRAEPPERPSDLLQEDWLEWTNGLWTFPGETNRFEDHPAPFPLELPRRLIRLLSFPGDLVVDPFLGSGTTALAAVQAGRAFWGCDAEPDYVAASKRRVAGWAR